MFNPTEQSLPSNVIPSREPMRFDERSVPGGLLRPHDLREGRWGVLHVLEGSVVFEDLEGAGEQRLEAPARHLVTPQRRHRLRFDAAARCQLDLFRPADEDAPAALPHLELRESFKRAEAAAEAQGRSFAADFYDRFLAASPEIAPFFAETNFSKQRKLLRATVQILAARALSDPHLLATLQRVGETHSRQGFAVPRALYELWVQAVLDTLSTLDPEWNDALAGTWQTRLWAGVQLITSRF